MSVRPLLSAVLDLALPRRCGGCDLPGHAVCPECAGDLLRAGRDPAFPVLPTPCPPGFPDCFAQAPYDGALAAMLRAYKDDGRADLRRDLAPLLRSSVAAALRPRSELVTLRGGPVLVVPVPSSARAVRRRGRDPLSELVRQAVGHMPTLRVWPALRLRRSVRDQAELTAQARADNLQEAMGLRPGSGPDGCLCVVVDDIVTTGATLTEATRVLRSAGARDVVAAVVAATRRHDHGQAVRDR